MKKLTALIAIILLAVFVITSCTPDSPESVQNSVALSSAADSASNLSKAESSSATSTAAITSDTTSSDGKVKLSDHDVILMSVMVDGTERDICLNEMLYRREFDFNNELGEDKTFDFAVLTDFANSNKPTLVRAGDTFMGFEITEVSVEYYCYNDKIYPKPVISIKMKGKITGKSILTYGHLDDEDDIYLHINPTIELFEQMPYPIYTFYNYSPNIYDLTKDKYKEVMNLKEIVEKYNLSFGTYEGEIEINEVNINFAQPGAAHYISVSLDSTSVQLIDENFYVR